MSYCQIRLSIGFLIFQLSHISRSAYSLTRLLGTGCFDGRLK